MVVMSGAKHLSHSLYFLLHVSALLHALVALKPGKQCCETEEESDEESQPVISLSCQWKPPRKRKASALQVSVAEFEKHEYGRTKKYKIQNLEMYDPCPERLRNIIGSRISKFLDQVRGKGLCISLLLDPSICIDTPQQPVLTKEELLKKVKKKLKVSDVKSNELQGIN